MRTQQTDVVYDFWGITLVITAVIRPDDLWEAVAIMHTNAGVIYPPIISKIGITRQEAIMSVQRHLLTDMEAAWLNNSQTFIY